MWIRVVVAGFVLLAVGSRADAAATVYWCDAAQGYYPEVPTCPIPWRPLTLNTVPQSAAPFPREDAEPPLMPMPQKKATEGAAAPAMTKRGDALDPWCEAPTTALNVAICGDADLRALAIDRLHALYAARARLAWDQQKQLVADQNGWAATSAASCGLKDDAPPTLPLDPTIKNCLTDAGRARLAYLQAYGAEAKDSEDKDSKDNPAPDAASAAPALAPADSLAPAEPDATTQAAGPAKPPSAAASETPVRIKSQLTTSAAPPWASPAAGQPAAQ